jgi:hypothetical protein
MTALLSFSGATATSLVSVKGTSPPPSLEGKVSLVSEIGHYGVTTQVNPKRLGLWGDELLALPGGQCGGMETSGGLGDALASGGRPAQSKGSWGWGGTVQASGPQSVRAHLDTSMPEGLLLTLPSSVCVKQKVLVSCVAPAG